MRTTTIIAAALLAACAVPATAGADEIEPWCEPEAADWQAGYDELANVDQYNAWTAEEPAQTINAYDGVYSYGGRLETYYSSSALYHPRTPEWWCDGQGFWRTPEGYYVVAASDCEQGAVIETSMGLAQVLDCGCAWGVTDFYTNWL